MSNELIVALIALVASLSVAVISIIGTILSNRQSTRNQRAIEQLKFKLDSFKAKNSIEDEYLVASVNSLGTAIKSIQNVKDDVQLILSAISNGLDTESALRRIGSARERLFVCFEEKMVDLQSLEEKKFHRAKSLSLAIENFLLEVFKGKLYASELSNAERYHLFQLRSELTEIQNLLRDYRTEKMLRRTIHEE